METAFKIKKDGKFITVARFGLNKFGNKRLSIAKPVLIELLKGEGDWIDLSVFENEEKPQQAHAGDDNSLTDDTIPF